MIGSLLLVNEDPAVQMITFSQYSDDPFVLLVTFVSGISVLTCFFDEYIFEGNFSNNNHLL